MAIPAAVTVYGKMVDERIRNVELEIKRQEQANAIKQQEKEFMTRFVSQAVDRDINARLRFTDYFAHLAEETEARRWAKFQDDLISQKTKIMDEISTLEDRLNSEELTPIERARFIRLVQTYYDEIGINRTLVAPTSSPDLPDKPPPADSSLFRIQQSQQNKQYLTFEYLQAKFGEPGRPGTDRCVRASNPAFLGLLRSAPMLDPRQRVTMLQPLWTKMNTDIGQFTKEHPDITGKLLVESFECVKIDKGSGKLTPNSYAISANVYLDGDDKLAQDVENWSPDKVQGYQKLVTFMNERGWIWTPTLTPRFTSNFAASRSAL
ncbi:hypothetical protein [Bradyrhizobium sp. B117]|uniref:hypothetical protein n=1 Tax=Bradyrhizobium sp. B117 TaxID=3140246 RepID=UPI003182C1E8